MRRAVLLALFVALVAAAGAQATRQPTLKEREALTALMPSPTRSFPAGCEWLKMEVSNDGRWASVEPIFLNATHQPCRRYAERAGNGGFMLEKKGGKWRVVFEGSDAPPCRLHIPFEISDGCYVCHGAFCTLRTGGR